jgi:hypothetical protein
MLQNEPSPPRELQLYPPRPFPSSAFSRFSIPSSRCLSCSVPPGRSFSLRWRANIPRILMQSGKPEIHLAETGAAQVVHRQGVPAHRVFSSGRPLRSSMAPGHRDFPPSRLRQSHPCTARASEAGNDGNGEFGGLRHLDVRIFSRARSPGFQLPTNKSTT